MGVVEDRGGPGLTDRRGEVREMEIKRVMPEKVKEQVVNTVLKLVEENHLTIFNLEEIHESIRIHMLGNATLEKELSKLEC